ncbi:MAG: exopolysaccharide biosynthesis polyprenyl glycosylphosphotransferase [Lachnospiraceae bacterium]|nr:exopolysaccharide biosynthesis polyprenyl glycosylphosphotransferase [Lachnospiraceae bacterium]
MGKLDSIKRILVLQLVTFEFILDVAGYAIIWFLFYKKMIRVQFWQKGDALVIGIYAICLFSLLFVYGAGKIGYLRSFEIFLSHAFSIGATNIVAYAVICLMYGHAIDPKYIIVLGLIQLLFALGWSYLSNLIYRSVFSPRDLLLICGERPVDEIVEKFKTRKDRFEIVKIMNISEGEENIMKEIPNRYQGVVIWDVPQHLRNNILKFCYSKSIRVYMMPKISDVIVQGADVLHFFDTPILLTREYPLTFEQRCIKRLIDLFCAIILIILTTPIMIVTAILIKITDGGPVFYKQVRMTINNKEFKIIKFRSMKVDAEADGKARLASKNDSRITWIGKIIRAVRIDELPQLFNIVKGDMSFIGPRPERPEIIEQYMKDMPEFAFRTKVKAGLAGYAQVYGKYNTTPYDKLKLDLTYIEGYSTWLDIKLMLLTLRVLLTPDSTEGVGENQVTALKSEEDNDDESTVQ